MEEKFCPCCKNRCPVEALSCGRGRAYFGLGAESGGHESRGHGFAADGDEVVGLLRKCGHTLHHAHGHGDVKIECFTADERAQLIALLKKCLAELEK